MDIKKIIAEITKLHKELVRLEEAHKQSWLDKAVPLGKALLALQSETGSKGWTTFVNDNLPFRHTVAQRYMNAAEHEAIYRKAGAISDHQIRKLSPTLRSPGRRRSSPYYPAATIKEMKVMAEQGVTTNAIANALGVRHETVLRNTNPEYLEASRAKMREIERRRAAEQRELREAAVHLQRQKAIREMGGSTSRLYGLIQKACVEVDGAIREQKPRTLKQRDLKAVRLALIEAEERMQDFTGRVA